MDIHILIIEDDSSIRNTAKAFWNVTVYCRYLRRWLAGPYAVFRSELSVSRFRYYAAFHEWNGNFAGNTAGIRRSCFNDDST